LSLERDRRDDPVEGAQPVGRDDDAAAIRQIVIVTNLAPIVVWQLRDRGVRQNVVEMRRQRSPFDHPRELTVPAAAMKATAMEASMSKSSSEAAAEPAVPTSSTAPPAAPAPANRDPGPTPAPTPSRPTPTGPTPVGVWIIGVGAGVTIAGVGGRILIVG